MKKQNIKEIINKSLGKEPSEKNINEAYVAQEKQFEQITDSLSSSAKEAHLKLYKNYIDSFNKISAELDAADLENLNANNSRFRNLKIDETYNLNAIYLHEQYFANSADPASEVFIESLAYMRLNRDFGTFDDWQKSFIATALSSRTGWAVTGYNIFLRRYHNFFIDSHNMHVPIGVYPIIVVDMWEHAYFRDYLVNKKKYLLKQMSELNWSVIESRFKTADGLNSVLGK
jgi:superoxide dismutase, Fe-Mn family